MTVARQLHWSPDGDPADGDECCDTPFGTYRMKRCRAGYALDFAWGRSFRSLIDRAGSSRDDAIAAAQRDFERRVAECLAPAVLATLAATPAVFGPVSATPAEQVIRNYESSAPSRSGARP